jgi:hypothetical protein
VHPQPGAGGAVDTAARAGAPGGELSEQPPARDEARSRVTVAEVVLLAAACAVGLVALVSLAAAHLHHHTLTVVGFFSAVLLVAVAAAVVLLDRRPAMRLDVRGLLPIAVGLVFAAIMFFPGFEYGTGDRDPGAYIEHAVAITHSHSIEFPDDLANNSLSGPGPRPEWPALWDKPGHLGTIFPQFYHLWPALLATSYDVGGFSGLFNTGPLLAVIAVGLAVAVARRLGGVVAGWATALLLPANMLEVWQAKYPSAEIFGQMLFLGALLGVVLAVQTRWRAAAALAGVLVSLSYLERADGIVLVLIAWTALGALLAARKFDGRAAWFTGGLLVLLPYGFYQAYHLARQYTLANNVPSLAKVLAVMLGVGVLATALAWHRRLVSAVIDWVTPRRRIVLGTAFVALCGGLMLLGFLRPKLFGKDYQLYLGQRQRSYDEISLIRLSWFFSLPGIALVLAGFGYVAWRRWRFDRWVVALSTAGLLTLYCYHVRNSAYLMWSTRRFVTTVVPGMVILMGLGTALIVVVLRRYVHVLAATGAAAALVIGITVFCLSESSPLRSLNENGGSVEVEKQIAALAGPQRGVFLWQHAGACCAAPFLLFGGPLLAITDQSSALLPSPGGAENSALARDVDHFRSSGRPVFYIANGSARPPAISGVSSTKVLELAGVLPHWEETFISRPDTRNDYRYHFTVYRLGLR